MPFALYQFLFLTLLVRSGIQILSDNPKLYWNKHCTLGSEWVKFTKNIIPKDKLWTSMDEAVNVSPWITHPGGRHNLGIGRHWHFFAVAFWMLNGLGYTAFLFGTYGWRRLAPEFMGHPLANHFPRYLDGLRMRSSRSASRSLRMICCCLILAAWATDWGSDQACLTK